MGLNVSTGPDGIAVPGVGWTNQSSSYNSNKTLESYGAAASTIINPALRRGYSAWSFDAGLGTGTATGIGTTLAVAVYVPETFVCSNFDVYMATGTSNVTVALWPSTAPAGTATPLVWSAATAAVAGGVQTFTYGGASSPSSVTLIGGNTYLATMFGAATAPTVGCIVTSAAGMANAAPSGTYSITTTYISASVGTVTTVSAASVFGTSTLSATIPWVGLH